MSHPIDRPKFQQTDFTRLTETSVQTLQAYEERGLLRPERSPGGGPVYSDQDLLTARAIRSLAHLGMTLDEIAHIFAKADRGENLRAFQDRVYERRVALRDTIAEVLRVDGELVEGLAYVQRRAVT